MEVTRDELLEALYQATSKKDLLSQFETKISTFKGNPTEKYTQLLEQIIYFSHAIMYGQEVQTAHNYRQDFMTVAKKSKTLKLSATRVYKAFSFFNGTLKSDFVSNEEKLEEVERSLEKEPSSERLKAKKEKLEKAIEKSSESTEEVSDDCVAKNEIERLKEELDTKAYQYHLKKGQKADDTEIYIKVALVAMATGSRLQEIMETLKLSQRKGNIVFTVDGDLKKSVILELDYETVKTYLKDIRKHYADRIKKKMDISTGIRKAVKRLKVTASEGINSKLIESAMKRDNKLSEEEARKKCAISICGNLNHLNSLYEECIEKKK